jgi:translation initiation factor 4G
MKDKATERLEGLPQIDYGKTSIDNSLYPFVKGSIGKRGAGAGGSPGSQIININNNQLQSQQDVKLSTTENAYKPVKMVNTQLDETERVLRGVRTILNKLTPQNFQKLVSDLVQMEINVNEDRLRGTIDIIFEKSIDDKPVYSQTYANLCKALNTVCVDY